jgi:tRNA threonylcarbamoyl adenosine modification protein YeaZ
LRPDAPLLAFDTSAAHCAAALLSGQAVLAERSEEMGRGQAERLMPLLEDMLAGAGLSWRDLGAVAVGTGPGNFTGIRIAVATARGLAMSLGVPAVGVTGFAALAEGHGTAGPLLVTLPAPRDQTYAEFWHGGAPDGAPMLIGPAAAPVGLRVPDGLQVLGHRAEEIARTLGGTALPSASGNPARRLGRVAAMRIASGLPSDSLPAPVYVRPADAAPARDAPPVILP